MKSERLSATIDRGVATVRIGRSSRANAVDRPMAAHAISELERLRESPDVSVVVLAGTSRSFCAGADLSSLAEDLDEDGVHPIVKVIELLLDLEMPTIAAIDGPARGGGLELALACDIRIASRTATFGLPEISFGGIPGGGALQLLPHLVGRGRALGMALTGAVVDAPTAARIGLIDHLVESGRATTRATDLARQIAARPRSQVRYATQAVRDADRPSGGVIAASSRELARALRALHSGDSSPARDR